MSFRTFCPSVRLGNWNEDVALEEDILKDYLEKKDKGELLIQKTSNLKKNILKKTELSISQDGCLHFGDVVMLLNPENSEQSLSNTSPTNGNYALSVNPNENAVYSKTHLEAPCGVSGSTNLEPTVRNAFIITSVDGSDVGEPVHYGQNFALRTTEGFMNHLHLTSDQKTFLKSSKKSYLQEVSLTDQLSYQNCWNFIYLDPQLRLENEGFPVPANTKLLIVHSKTNQCLAVLRKQVLWTFFGKECEITAHTFLNGHKAEENENHWIVVTGNPSNGLSTMFDRPAPSDHVH
ncbi:cilia- and flagella-associated protein 161 [Xenopus tropicalis]|uniref:Cilia- and flagella-associated protein 161 n=1 Tax=Xenopus tropicalis TaxID=8364 RepID=B0BM99_XENTR|nr:cilia- and flagella-associated protein 161 [Xenopus tropicalis]AAI58343.1 LOC100145001 protein [Xenopus tropicalis]|eukprot:NP_001120035.1 cilia- and flagella-associated protein 161 [Xenopus tropicalis]